MSCVNKALRMSKSLPRVVFRNASFSKARRSLYLNRIDIDILPFFSLSYLLCKQFRNKVNDVVVVSFSKAENDVVHFISKL